MHIQNTARIGWLVPLAAACIALFAAPSMASAAERYATPNPAGGADCSQPNPCSVQSAIEGAAGGDEVIVGTGTYNEGTDQIAATVPDISIHGAPGQPRPEIKFDAVTGNSSFALSGGGTASLRRLAIDSAGDRSALTIAGTGGVAEQLVVRSTTSEACEINTPSFTLRDSVCATTADQHAAVASGNYGVGQTWALALRNVTASATGSPGWGVFASTNGDAKITVDAKNVIAQGGAGGISGDVFVTNGASPNAESTVNLSDSNFDSRCEYLGGCFGGPGLSITAPGSGTNQTAAPVFTDAAFHQDAASPTVDKGTSDASVGNSDVDGDQRSVGNAIDIGADEFVPPAPPPPPPPSPTPGQPDPPVVSPEDPVSEDPPVDVQADTDPPETSIRKAPPSSLQRTTAGFRFASDEAGSTFRCKLDRGAYRPCASGRRYRHLAEGKHRFRVAATDAAGNVDPTPAGAGFRVAAP